MVASEGEEERADLISRMFALLTAKLEDAAAIAADCQGRRSAEHLREAAAKLREMIGELATVCDGTIWLLEGASGATVV